MAVLTLGQIKTQSRELADMETSSFISESELTSIINRRLAKLHSYQAEMGEKYNVTSSTITLSPNVQEYNLPTDFFKAVGLDLLVEPTTNSYITLKTFEWKERNQYWSTYYINQYLSSYRYCIWSSKINIRPMPTAADILKFWYEPKFAYLVNDADTFDFIEGWEDYVILPSAIYMITKQEGDTRELRELYNEAKTDIQNAIQNRMEGPGHIVETDSRSTNLWGMTREIV